MNLPKAIELGKDAEKSLRDHKFIDHANAILVLIGAGERVEASKWKSHDTIYIPLSGETEE